MSNFFGIIFILSGFTFPFLCVAAFISFIRNKTLGPWKKRLLVLLASMLISFVLLGVTLCNGEKKEINRIEPTCTSEGTITYECIECGEITTETIDKLNHSLEEVSRTEPTNEKSGVIIEKCTVCGISLQTILEPLKLEEAESTQTPETVPTQTPKPSSTPESTPKITHDPSGEKPKATPKNGSEVIDYLLDISRLTFEDEITENYIFTNSISAHKWKIYYKVSSNKQVSKEVKFEEYDIKPFMEEVLGVTLKDICFDIFYNIEKNFFRIEPSHNGAGLPNIFYYLDTGTFNIYADSGKGEASAFFYQTANSYGLSDAMNLQLDNFKRDINEHGLTFENLIDVSYKNLKKNKTVSQYLESPPEPTCAYIGHTVDGICISCGTERNTAICSDVGHSRYGKCNICGTVLKIERLYDINLIHSWGVNSFEELDSLEQNQIIIDSSRIPLPQDTPCLDYWARVNKLRYGDNYSNFYGSPKNTALHLIGFGMYHAKDYVAMVNEPFYIHEWGYLIFKNNPDIYFILQDKYNEGYTGLDEYITGIVMNEFGSYVTEDLYIGIDLETVKQLYPSFDISDSYDDGMIYINGYVKDPLGSACQLSLFVYNNVVVQAVITES